MMTTAATLLSHFHGRSDYIAVAHGTGFKPHPCPDGIPPEWLDEHIQGRQCYGFYLLTPESDVMCSCVDIDNKPEHPNPAWQQQAESLYWELSGANLYPIVELSQSEQGAHVWLLHSEPIEAWVVRAFWRGWESRVGFRFREIFPKQDRLRGEGVGNLIRWPLWKSSRFVDVENGWAEIPADEALRCPQKTDRADLFMRAQTARFRIEKPATVGTGSADDGLSPRVRRLVSRPHTILARRWLNDARGMNDPSPSAVAMSLVCELVRAYIPTIEIESALRCWLRRHDRGDKAARPDWISTTIDKAYEFMLDPTEAKSEDLLTLEGCSARFLDRMEKGTPAHIGSGLPAFDACVDGVAPGEVCVIAARPSHGKSAFALQWTDHAARCGYTPLIISEEMQAEELGKRHLQTIYDRDSDRWTENDVGPMRQTLRRYHADGNPAYVVENCCTIDRTEQVVDQMCSVYGVNLVAVDYLQLLGSTGNRLGRYETVTDASRRIKQAAQRNSCAVLLLSQMSRAVETRKTTEPMMSDLRESGQIEQDADLIVFLRWPYREDSKKYADSKSKYVIHIAKRRNGPIRQQNDRMEAGVVITKFDPYRQRIG